MLKGCIRFPKTFNRDIPELLRGEMLIISALPHQFFIPLDKKLLFSFESKSQVDSSSVSSYRMCTIGKHPV